MTSYTPDEGGQLDPPLTLFSSGETSSCFTSASLLTYHGKGRCPGNAAESMLRKVHERHCLEEQRGEGEGDTKEGSGRLGGRRGRQQKFQEGIYMKERVLSATVTGGADQGDGPTAAETGATELPLPLPATLPGGS